MSKEIFISTVKDIRKIRLASHAIMMTGKNIDIEDLKAKVVAFEETLPKLTKEVLMTLTKEEMEALDFTPLNSGAVVVPSYLIHQFEEGTPFRLEEGIFYTLEQ